MTEPTNAEIRKYLDKYAYTAGFSSDMAKVILDRLEAAERKIGNCIAFEKAQEASLQSVEADTLLQQNEETN